MALDLRLRFIRFDKHSQEVTRLLNEGFPNENWTSSDVQKFICRLKRHNCLQILILGTEIVGCVLYSLDGPRCVLRRITVTERYRRKGFGKFIVNDLRASSLAKREFVYRCRGDNENGWRFIKSLPDFVFDKENRYKYEDEMDSYCFRCAGIKQEKETYATVG